VSLHENIIQYSEEEEAEYESDEPNIQLEVDSNGMEQYAYVNGTVLSGAGEEGDVIVELAFEEDNFNASAVGKYDTHQILNPRVVCGGPHVRDCSILMGTNLLELFQV
jgi:hypothetical protein